MLYRCSQIFEFCRFTCTVHSRYCKPTTFLFRISPDFLISFLFEYFRISKSCVSVILKHTRSQHNTIDYTIMKSFFSRNQTNSYRASLTSFYLISLIENPLMLFPVCAMPLKHSTFIISSTMYDSIFLLNMVSKFAIFLSLDERIDRVAMFLQVVLFLIFKRKLLY